MLNKCVWHSCKSLICLKTYFGHIICLTGIPSNIVWTVWFHNCQGMYVNFVVYQSMYVVQTTFIMTSELLSISRVGSCVCCFVFVDHHLNDVHYVNGMSSLLIQLGQDPEIVCHYELCPFPVVMRCWVSDAER